MIEYKLYLLSFLSFLKMFIKFLVKKKKGCCLRINLLFFSDVNFQGFKGENKERPFFCIICFLNIIIIL